MKRYHLAYALASLLVGSILSIMGLGNIIGAPDGSSLYSGLVNQVEAAKGGQGSEHSNDNQNNNSPSSNSQSASDGTTTPPHLTSNPDINTNSGKGENDEKPNNNHGSSSSDVNNQNSNVVSGNNGNGNNGNNGNQGNGHQDDTIPGNKSDPPGFDAGCTGNPHDFDQPTGNPHDPEKPTGNPHECFEFVVPESPVGMIALSGSSLSALGAYLYFRQ